MPRDCFQRELSNATIDTTLKFSFKVRVKEGWIEGQPWLRIPILPQGNQASFKTNQVEIWDIILCSATDQIINKWHNYTNPIVLLNPVILNIIYRSCSLHIALLMSLKAWKENKHYFYPERAWPFCTFSGIARIFQEIHTIFKIHLPTSLESPRCWNIFTSFCSYKFAQLLAMRVRGLTGLNTGYVLKTIILYLFAFLIIHFFKPA